MEKIYKLHYVASLILLLVSVKISPGQTPWTTIDPANGYFTFRLPDNPEIYNTPTLTFYSYTVDPNIIIQVYYYRSDTIFGDNGSDSTDNPLLVFAAELLLTTNGTLAELNDVILPPNVRTTLAAKEIAAVYPVSEEDDEYVFTRVYHDGESMLIFYIYGPENRITDLLAYKETLFQGISILN
jgi:hypothetical protein